MYVLVYGTAAKASIHAAECACVDRLEWFRHRVPNPVTLPTAVTLVDALHARPVKLATEAGYRITVSKCVRRR